MIKMTEEDVEETDFFCQAYVDLKPLIELEEKIILELKDKNQNSSGKIILEIVWYQEFHIKIFLAMLKVSEVFFSKAQSS